MSRLETKVGEFQNRLLDWGVDNSRKYPWRWTDDPYRVLVSEFMLHRTQVKQVVQVYTQFMEKYPTLEGYSKAEESQLRDVLKPLGLTWRINSMVKALSYLWNEYQDVPLDRDRLIAVDGIGRYIADATICFTLNVPVPLIDTNTVRVVGRVFGLDLSGEARRRKSVVDMISVVCDPDEPRNYYYAMIDFAHQVCTPKKPDCASCFLLNLPCVYGTTRLSQVM